MFIVYKLWTSLFSPQTDLRIDTNGRKAKAAPSKGHRFALPSLAWLFSAIEVVHVALMAGRTEKAIPLPAALSHAIDA